MAVDFGGKVKYSGVSVTVKDSAGASYTARVTDRDDDELDFRVAGIRAGKSYTFTIQGIRNRYGSVSTSVSGSFKTPKASAIVIESVEYDADDRELKVAFKNKVHYSSPTVKLTDSAGNTVEATIKELDDDELELQVAALQQGARYTLKISGIKNRNASRYTSVTKTFVAWDD